MNNYNDLFRRGFRYTTNAAENWYKRRDKITSASFSKYGNERPTDNRYFKLWNELSQRIEAIGLILHQIKEKEKKQTIEAGMQLVKLECQTFTCKYSPVGIGVMVYLKDYKPGTYKCKTCGSELRTKEDLQLDEQLMELGIKTSNE